MIYFDGVIGIVLFLMGFWGRRTSAQLVPTMLDTEAQEKKERVMRRGAVILMIVGVLVVAAVLTRILLPLFR